MRAWVGCVALMVAGCDQIGLPVEDEEGFPDDKIFFSIGDPQPGVPVGSFQEQLDGWSYLFDITDPANPVYECQHTDDDMLVKAALHRFLTPDAETCAVPTQAEGEADPAAPAVETQVATPTPFPATHTGLAGTNPLPLEQGEWYGAAGGGCAIWATAMCNRRLGVTPPETQVTKAEWDDLAARIGTKPNGGTSWLGVAAYYRQLGYCTVEKDFWGDAEGYQEIMDNLDACDIKLHMSRKNGDEYVDGHVETVVSAAPNHLVTNSWGAAGAIEGGMLHADFGHWKNGKRWKRADGGEMYPKGGTNAWVSYVCPCTHPMMESLGDTILRSLGLGG